MIVKKLELENFRNYKSLDLDLDPKKNVLYGNNAQGKTNILESIYICSTTKSHRSNKDVELIRFGEREAHIKLFIEKKEKEVRVDVHLRKNKTKGIAVNGVPIKRASELFGIFNVIFFAPEDLNIIKNGPAERRRFMDLELCQLDKIYVHNLINYNKVLNQRNRLLKEISFNPSAEETLDVWDEQLVLYGKEIIKKREEFIKQISKIIKPIHEDLTNKEEAIKIDYHKNTEVKDFEKNLKRNRSVDLRNKSTSVGPHRDDILFFNKDINIRTYGSQGQKRTIALSLKLAEIELVKKIINDTPVLLLDDVLSELDSERQNHLLERLDNIQTIVTCTGLDEFVENSINIDRVFKVDNAKVAENVIS